MTKRSPTGAVSHNPLLIRRTMRAAGQLFWARGQFRRVMGARLAGDTAATPPVVLLTAELGAGATVGSGG